MNQLSWFSANNKHRLKLTSELRRDAYAQDQTTNLLGTFTFNSLADLAAGRPASFTRQLSPRERERERSSSAALSLGDSYRPTHDLQLQYGVRLDGNRFDDDAGVQPATSSSRSACATTTCRTRSTSSPRVGFSWTYGTAPQIGAFDGAVRGPRAVVRGGIGVFQNTPNATLDRSGDRQHRAAERACSSSTCVGAAAPIAGLGRVRDEPGGDPDAVRRRHDGHACSPARAPNVTLFAKDYAAPRSAALEPAVERPDPRQPVRRRRSTATYSLNLNQAEHRRSQLQARRSSSRCRTRAAGRCTCSRRASCRRTGAIASGDARVTPLFSHVSELRSDLRVGEPAAARLQLAPPTFNTTLHVEPRRTCYAQRARAVSRLREHGRQSARRRVGPLGASTRAIRSSTRSATTSSTPCA